MRNDRHRDGREDSRRARAELEDDEGGEEDEDDDEEDIALNGGEYSAEITWS